MGASSPWGVVRQRLAAKWQGPLLLLSLMFLGVALLRMRPTPANLPLERALPHLDRLVAAGLFEEAIEFGGSLLEHPEYTDVELAPATLALARAWYGEALRRNAANPVAGRTIAWHYKRSAAFELPLLATDLLALGEAYEWQGDFSAAVAQYREALDLGVTRPLDVRKRMLGLRLDYLNAPPESVSAELDTLIADAGESRADVLLWGVDRKLRALEALERFDAASVLVESQKNTLIRVGFADYVAYLETWLLYKRGQYDEAEARIRAIQSRVDPDGDVYAKAGWLLGRVILRDEGPKRPLEALSVFEDVLRRDSRGPYGVAARVGVGESLALLERHGEAVLAFRMAMGDLDRLRAPYPVDRSALRVFLSVLADTQRRLGREETAVDYARLAARLIEEGNLEQSTMLLQQLAEALVVWGDSLAGDDPAGADDGRRPREARSEAARRAYGEAAATHLQIAQRNVLKEAISSDAHWRAAELFALAGDRESAVDLFQSFVQERPHHALVGRGLLRIGQLLQAAGRHEEAVAAYRECFARFPRTIDGSRALVPLAQCYLAMDADHWDLAERTLHIVLEESEVFTPHAPEFVDAQFLLGDVLNRSGQYERAIGVLEESIERYPEDRRIMRARYLLADSYRRSGLSLKRKSSEALYAGEVAELAERADRRLQRAQERYRRLIQEYESKGVERLSRLERMYLRHARLYEADCFFETRDYRRALKLYEEAAATYKDSPSALAAYVQILNCHIFLGEIHEARAALARAKVSAGAIPAEAFARSVAPETQSDWRRYFEWLESVELF